MFPISTDCAAWLIGLLVGAVLKLALAWPNALLELALAGTAAMVLQALIGTKTGIYRFRWRFSSFEEMTALSFTWLSVTILVAGGNYVFRYFGSDLPSSAIFTGSMATFGLLGSSRIVWRRYWELRRRPTGSYGRQTVIMGAGDGGNQVIRAMVSDPASQYVPVAILDDDPMLANREIAGIPVQGTRSDLAQVASKHRADLLLIAIPSATSGLIQELSALAQGAGLEVRVLPAMSELFTNMTVADVRPPTVDDLLGRDPVEINLESVSGYIRGRRVLITGAGGSIGSELSRQVSLFDPSELYLLDRDESALHGLQLSMDGRGLLDTEQLIVANIRDRDRIFEIFERYRPEVVFHAAALKHLTLLENHPTEAVKTNVLGTRNLLDAAAKVNVQRFVNISTDKAADPTSVLGATKLAAERLTAKAAEEAGNPFLSVRFGNVLGSRGSVLPTFLDQLEKGNPLTVTHPDATRFFMTIPEAVRLVVQAGAIGQPGEVLILDMGNPIKILDLANQLIAMMRPGATVQFTGLRQGEKLHETVFASGEIGVAKVHDRIIHTRGECSSPLKALETMHPDALAAAHRLLADDPISTSGGAR